VQDNPAPFYMGCMCQHVPGGHIDDWIIALPSQRNEFSKTEWVNPKNI
jgi:hypothetical protein